MLQLLFPCAAGRGRAALELVPHREHPLDDLEILRAAPVVEGEAAAVEDLAHGEREDLEALDEGLVVRVVDVDDDDPDGLTVAAALADARRCSFGCYDLLTSTSFVRILL